MAKLGNSLQTKLTVSFVALILIISGMSFFYTYEETKTALKETLGGQLKSVASVIATQIDGDAMIKLKPGDEKTKDFFKMRDQLLAMQKSDQDIKYIYTYVQGKGKSVKFIIDATYGQPGAEEPASIGDNYDETTPEMLAGLKYPAAEKTFSTDKWGSFMSGYAPVKDSKGKNVGAVGVDMLSAKVLQKQDFIGGTIYFVIGIAVIIAGLIILLFSATIIRDINKLNKLAENVSTGQIDQDVDVKRKDEIGELADSFQRMIVSLRIMKMYPDEKKDKK